MTARKRLKNESFKKYRENLKAESRALKQRLRGWLVWDSSGENTYRRKKT